MNFEIVQNCLRPTWTTWSDPGIYPSNAGGYALPSRPVIEEIEGHVTIIGDTEDEAEWQDVLIDVAEEVLAGMRITEWQELARYYRGNDTWERTYAVTGWKEN